MAATSYMLKDLQFYKLHDGVTLPKRATKGAACFDISYFPHTDFVKGYSRMNGEFTREINLDDRSISIMPGERLLLPTGLIADIPEGWYLKAYTRSSVGFKKGLGLAQGVGVIDNDYVEEMFIPIVNNTDVRVRIEPGERLIQIEMLESLEYDIKETTTRPKQKTDRKGGFGSTNKKD